MEELITRRDLKVDTQFIVQIYSDLFSKICAKERSLRPRAGNHVKQQGEKSPRRPGLVEVTNRLQVKCHVKTVEMKKQHGRNSHSRSQTNRTGRSRRSSVNTRAFTICPTRTTRIKRREQSWSSSSPSPCSRVVSVFLHSILILH